MNIEPSTNSTPGALTGDLSAWRLPDARLADQRDFRDALGAARSAPGAPDARESAEALVSTALVQPILKQMRESSEAAPPFGPNAAERNFRSMMDTILAQRLVHSTSWGLVGAVEQRLTAGASKGGGRGL